MKPVVTIIMSTRNRALLLENTLQSLLRQDAERHLWQALVVNNDSTDETGIVISAMSKRLPIISLVVHPAGKAMALNKALDCVDTDLVMLTDDDVIPVTSWISQYLAVARTRPEVDLFSGPIIPLYPPTQLQWMESFCFKREAFAHFEPQLHEGLLPEGVLPYGPNVMIRLDIGKRFRFNESLGPSLRNGALPGDDIDFMYRVRSAGHQCMYLPSAGVAHVIRTEQLEIEWIKERFFNLGRSMVLLAAHPTWLSKPWSNGHARKGSEIVIELKRTRIERIAEINFIFGQLKEFHTNGAIEDCKILIRSIRALELDASRKALGSSAQALLASMRSLYDEVTN